MSRWSLAALAVWLPLAINAAPVAGQWYTPQSDRDLRLTWNAERMGPSRVLILGDIQNLSAQPATRIVLRAEGLDEAGKVVSRARGHVAQEVPSHGTANFEIRLVTSGSERRYRVTIDYFEFVDPFQRESRSP